MMDQRPALRIEIEQLTIDPVSQMPVVVLRIPDRDKVFPFWVGVFEANGIATELEGISAPRPMTHDLLKNTIQAMGGTVTRVAITDLRNGTFFAGVFIHLNGEELVIDARPSDAFSLALRCHAPMFVDTKVLERVEVFDSAKALFAKISLEARGLNDRGHR